ncbi:hypothetical protein [Enterococcus gallinarum]|uniref:hypothetical protein n=1 Tax=Enterococcus gallinarum TaxID=1353 RepID=UPI0028917C83|nr:hypothetical protein [Enterococcus gallinarum]MDT2685805.1 hypothetical protein [Enterococcus gallinarum]
MPNPFGGDVFGAMWEAVEENASQRADEALKIMKEVINKKTGALSDAVEKEKIGDASYLVGINEQKLINDPRNAGNVNYVPYYYYGSKPHIIRAKNGKALHWRINGKDYYAKLVRHPGNKPHNFIQDTLDRMKK